MSPAPALPVHVPALLCVRAARAVPALLCPVLCVCLYCGRQKHEVAGLRAILLLCQCDGSALLLRLYALSKPSRPASRGGSPLRQDLAAPVRPKGSPPALSFHNDYLILADFRQSPQTPPANRLKLCQSPQTHERLNSMSSE